MLGLPRIWDEYFTPGGGWGESPSWQGYTGGGGNPHGGAGSGGTLLEPLNGQEVGQDILSVPNVYVSADAIPPTDTSGVVESGSASPSVLQQVADWVSNNPVLFGVGGVGLLILFFVIFKRSR